MSMSGVYYTYSHMHTQNAQKLWIFITHSHTQTQNAQKSWIEFTIFVHFESVCESVYNRVCKLVFT